MMNTVRGDQGDANRLWRAVAWLVDEHAWRRRMGHVWGNATIVAALKADGCPSAVAEHLTAGGWSVSEETEGRIIATRQGPRLGGRSGAVERLDEYEREVREAFLRSGSTGDPQYAMWVSEQAGSSASYRAGWSEVPTWFPATTRSRVLKGRKRLAMSLGGYRATAPEPLLRALPPGAFLKRHYTTAEMIRGTAGVDARDRRWARGVVLVAMTFIAVTLAAQLPTRLRAWMASMAVWSIEEPLRGGACWTLGACAVLLALRLGARRSWVEAFVASALLSTVLLLSLMMARQAAASWTSWEQVALAAVCLAPLGVAGAVVAGIRASTWNRLVQNSLIATVLLAAMRGAWFLAGLSYGAGLGVWGWSASLPLVGLVEGAGTYALMLLLMAGSCGAALIAMSVFSRWAASTLGVLMVAYFLLLGLLLFARPYAAGQAMRQGNPADRWGHVFDRVCAVTDPEKFGVDPRETYWAVPGDRDRVLLVPAHPLAAHGPRIVPQDAVSMEVIQEGETCASRVKAG